MSEKSDSGFWVYYVEHTLGEVLRVQTPPDRLKNEDNATFQKLDVIHLGKNNPKLEKSVGIFFQISIKNYQIYNFEVD